MLRKLLAALAALTFTLSLAASAPAETKSGTGKPADPAKTAESAKKTEAKKEKSHQLTGIVEAVDNAGGTLTVKGKKVSVSLRAGDTVDLSKINVGEKVLVQYRGNTAYSVKKVTSTKAESGNAAKPEKPPASAPAGK